MYWYVLQVKTGKELAVKKKLQLNAPGITVLVPRKKMIERRQGVLRHAIKIVFPSYVFIKTFLDDEIYYAAMGIPEVYRFLGVNRPEPIPKNEMRIVLQLCSESDLLEISAVEFLQPGQKVRVISGPLKGLEGNIVSVNKRKFKAKVRFMLLNEPREISLGIEVVQASQAS